MQTCSLSLPEECQRHNSATGYHGKKGQYRTGRAQQNGRKQPKQ